MSSILIDANVWLEFYASAKLQELLPALNEFKDDILVTNQILCEVERNRLRQARRFLDQTYLQKPVKVNAPRHLVTLTDAMVERINKFNAESNALTKDLQAAYLGALEAIAKGSDIVSVALAALFAESNSASAEELKRAEHRKTIGNPPGKPNDPLGDQITWEQYLTEARHHGVFWIITRDHDYYDQLYDGQMTLNPLLYRELCENSGCEADVRCFSTLSDGLKDFAASRKQEAKSMPPAEKLAEIKTEEEALPQWGIWLDTDPPGVCPHCHGAATFKNSAYLRSRYGGLTLQYICGACGYHFDTGDFFD